MSAPDFSAVAARIQTSLVESGAPSLAVAVAREGEILWEAAFGWADRERRIPATPHTMYSLASISKPITSTAIRILHERGKLDVKASVDDYLQAPLRAAAGGGPATIEQLANHTSGMPLHYHFFYGDEPARPPAFTETLRRYGVLYTPPGERFQYSNLGYGVLDHVITRCSGVPYADFMRREVFLPLGMTRVDLGERRELDPYRAVRYGEDGLPNPHYDFDHPGGSAAWASAHDLIRFGAVHSEAPLSDQRSILSSESIAEMQRPTTTREHNGYGFGWGSNEDEHGELAISHSGGMGGVNTLLKLLPRHRIAVVALCNACGRLPFDIAEDLTAALLPAYARRLESDRAEAKPLREPDPPFRGDRRLNGEWSGEAALPDGPLPVALRIARTGEIHVRIGDRLWSLVNDVKWSQDALTGRMYGDLPGTEVRPPYLLHLDLKLRGRLLNGALVARTELAHPQGGAPHRRMGDALSYWLELRR